MPDVGAMKIKHANELFLLKRKFKLEEFMCYVQNNIEDIRINEVGTFDILQKLQRAGFLDTWTQCIKFMSDEPLYFEFGKYKNRIVQDVFEQDEQYCIWFIKTIRGEDLNTLKILNYLNHVMSGRDCYTLNPYDVGLQFFMKVLTPEELTDNEKDIKQYLQRIRTYEDADNCSYDYEDIGLYG